MSEYGYVRHYSDNQGYETELAAVQDVAADGIFIDDQKEDISNKDQIEKLVNMVTPGDTVFIYSIEHLGRNYADIGDIWKRITIEKGADICVLNMELLDTRKYRNSSIEIDTVDLVLELLTYFAEREKVQAKAIQADGIERALKENVVFGRPVCQIPEDFAHIVDQWERKIIPLDVALERSGMSRATWYRRVRELHADAL